MKKSKSNEAGKVKKTVKKKWSKIVQLVDSSDDETHLPVSSNSFKIAFLKTYLSLNFSFVFG